MNNYFAQVKELKIKSQKISNSFRIAHLLIEINYSFTKHV